MNLYIITFLVIPLVAYLIVFFQEVKRLSVPASMNEARFFAIMSALVAGLLGVFISGVRGENPSAVMVSKTYKVKHVLPLNATLNGGLAWVVTLDEPDNLGINQRFVISSADAEFMTAPEGTEQAFTTFTKTFPAWRDSWSYWNHEASASQPARPQLVFNKIL